MKPVIIIAIAFVLLIPITAYADVQVSGTTIFGSSDADIVQILITNSDGIVFQENVSVDETFEMELPRLHHGEYTLSMKHGAIGGDQEVIEFTYTGPEPIVTGFTIDIIYSDLLENDSILAEYNNAINWQKLKPLILESDYPLEFLEVVSSEMSELDSIASQELSQTPRYNSDGTETKEYLDSWMDNYVYYRFGQDYVRAIIDRVNEGMSLETAISQIEPKAEDALSDYVPPPTETPQPISKTFEIEPFAYHQVYVQYRAVDEVKHFYIFWDDVRIGEARPDPPSDGRVEDLGIGHYTCEETTITIKIFDVDDNNSLSTEIPKIEVTLELDQDGNERRFNEEQKTRLCEISEEEPEQIECEAEICVEECNTMSNCTVTWVPEPEPEELQIPAPFVDQTKDPQFYVDRYNNEPDYKEWFDANFPEYSSIYQAVGLSEPIPEWVKGVFAFWVDGEISDDELKNAIAFLVESGIIELDT